MANYSKYEQHIQVHYWGWKNVIYNISDSPICSSGNYLSQADAIIH